MNFALNNAEIFKLTDQKGMFALGCEDDGLFITYNKIHHFPKNGDLSFLNSPYNSNNTLVLFNSPFAVFDNNGWLLDPAQLTFNGAWGTGRAAALLPVDYQLPK